MTAWAIAFGWNWLLIPAAIWFANGFRKAMLNPRFKLHSVSKAGDAFLVDVTRQELLPPWRSLREVWLLTRHPRYAGSQDRMAIREGDGKSMPCVPEYSSLSSGIGEAIAGLVRVSQARERELEELTKADARPN